MRIALSPAKYTYVGGLWLNIDKKVVFVIKSIFTKNCAARRLQHMYIYCTRTQNTLLWSFFSPFDKKNPIKLVPLDANLQ